MNQPVLVQIPGKESGDRWRLVGSWDGRALYTGGWVYEYRLDGYDHSLRIPHGFSGLNGASVPAFVRPIVKMGGRDMPDEAWIPHDLYHFYKGKLPPGMLYRKIDGLWESVTSVSPGHADRMFYNELKKEKHGLARFKAPLAYAGVRVAFWKNW